MSYGPIGSVAKAVVAVKSGSSKKKKKPNQEKNAFELCRVNLLDCKKNKPFKTR